MTGLNVIKRTVAAYIMHLFRCSAVSYRGPNIKHRHITKLFQYVRRPRLLKRDEIISVGAFG
jgi:hypothetical protein